MLSYRILSDSQVISRVLSGHREAFGVLVERYLSVVHALALARTGNVHDAEDVVQDSFLKAYRSLDSLRDREKFRSWLARITRNTSQNVISMRRREAALDSERGAGTLSVPPASPDREEIRELLRQRITQMTPQAREVLLLHYFAGRSTREIAHLLGITRHAAKKRLERARESLSRELLAELKPAVEPESPASHRAKKIMGCCLGTPTAWEASAGTAAVAVATAGPLTGKILAAGIVLCTGVILFTGRAVLFSPDEKPQAPQQAPQTARAGNNQSYPGAAVPKNQPTSSQHAEAANRSQSIPESPSSPPEKYGSICGVAVDLNAIDAGIELLLCGRTEYEFRTTIVPQLTKADILAIGRRVRGARSYVLQRYRRPESVTSRPDPRFDEPPRSTSCILGVLEKLKNMVQHCGIRGFDNSRSYKTEISISILPQ